MQVNIPYTSDEDDDYCEKVPAIRDFSRLPLPITEEMVRDMEVGGEIIEKRGGIWYMKDGTPYDTDATERRIKKMTNETTKVKVVLPTKSSQIQRGSLIIIEGKLLPCKFELHSSGSDDRTELVLRVPPDGFEIVSEENIMKVYRDLTRDAETVET